MTTPKLWQRTNADGKFFGSYHVTIKKRRINLHTQDVETARKRRALAMRGQQRFKDDSQGAAEKLIAALDATPDHTAGVVDGAARTPGADLPSGGAPPQLALPPMQPETPEPVIEPERIDAGGGSWTDDVAAAAGGATPDGAAADAGATAGGSSSVRLSDLPMMAGIFITASRLLVQLQVMGQVKAARSLFKVDLPMLSDPPPKDLADFLRQQSEKWPDTHPCEPGRQMWEAFLRRVCPDDFPVPDYIMAPILVGIGTLPLQIANAEKIGASAEPAAAAAQPTGAAPDATAVA